MKIGVVIAMDKEFRRVVSLLGEERKVEIYGRTFVTGTLGNNEIVALQCGIGKVNAAVGVTELVDGFKPDAIVSTGVAGGVSTELNVRDVVVSTALCYHDVYCGEELAYGQIPGLPASYVGDDRLLHVATSLAGEMKVVPGLIVTGDWFVDSREKMKSIVEKFPDAMAVDMESAAIAQVCYLRGIPFISFRIISDIPLKDTKASQYFDFWERIADGSFTMTKSFLEKI